jgi:uncharacterized membrane protein
MAGIGFKLEKILSKNSYLNLLEGYLYSTMVSAGPIIATIFSIGVITFIAMGEINRIDIVIFRTLVVYIYAISLIISSSSQMIITRYMADRIFLKDYEALVPAYAGITIFSIFLYLVIGIIGCRFIDLDLSSEIIAVVLLTTVGIIWIAMIALSAAKEFQRIARSFMYGAIVSVSAAYYLGIYLGILGLLTGFTAGMILLAVLLSVQIFNEFPYRHKLEFYFLSYFKQFPELAFIATFFNIGVWADKFVFWASPATRDHIHASLYASYIYDVPVFLAYLFIIPSLAMFTIRIETSFYVAYKKYYMSILNNHPFFSLEERRKNIVDVLKLSLGRMIAFQGTITIIGLIAAPAIYEWLGMSAINLGIFQISILSTFLLSLMLALLILMLYFDYRLDALFMSACFAVTNTAFSLISIKLGFSYYGFGYFFSTLVSLIVGFLLFNYRLYSLHYYTFVRQRVVVHEEALTTEERGALSLK